MVEKDINFENNLKISFNKVKEDILRIENEINQLKNEFLEKISYLESLIEEKAVNSKENGKITDNKPSLKDSSTGNDGVYSFIHSFNRYSTDIHSHIKSLFNRLSSQEFLTFLTLYQLEEDKGIVSYIDISKKLNLSEGCIRTYISSLLKKGAPLVKSKINNKQVILTIEQEFRKLNLKKQLIDLYYNQDPEQTKLSSI